MASGNLLAVFKPYGSFPPATNMATLDTRNNHPIANFDATTEETLMWEGAIPDNYAGGGLTVKVKWLGATATTGDVVWGSAIERLDTGTDMDADSYATEQTVTSTTNGTSGAPTIASITHSSGANMDSAVAGDEFRIKIARKAAAGGDTMTGDAQISQVEVYET